MRGLVSDVKPVLTDSLGILDETTVFGTPCIPTRGRTRRTSTVGQGANTTVRRDADAVPSAEQMMFSATGKGGGLSEYWDGRVVERIDSNVFAWLADCVQDRTVAEVA